MKLFDYYLFKNLVIATFFIVVTLSVVILLTQSLRFLELVIESGASSVSFWLLTILALPRFFEIIVPIALMAGVLFIYNRMNVDSELVVMRASGTSPLRLAKPALILALLVTVFLWGMTMWAAPKSLASMQNMRQIIKTQFSNLIFRENVFNKLGKGITVYMRERASDGELKGLMIHDTRDPEAIPSTVTAQRGKLLASDSGYSVVVYDGSRQQYNKESGVLQRLKFERYSIDLPNSGQTRVRWAQPDERTLLHLLKPDLENVRDMENLRVFKVDLHRRIISPLLALVFTLIALVSLLLGPVGRQGQGWRIAFVIGGVVVIQGLYLAAFNFSRNSDLGLVLMYALVLVPLFVCGFMLSGFSEGVRRKFLYKAMPRQERGSV